MTKGHSELTHGFVKAQGDTEGSPSEPRNQRETSMGVFRGVCWDGPKDSSRPKNGVVGDSKMFPLQLKRTR